MTLTPSTEIQFLSLADISPSPDNPRTIRPERMESLIRSVEHDPDMLRARPCIANADGHILAGNMRYSAVAASVDRDPAGPMAVWLKRAGGFPTFVVPVDPKRNLELMLRDNASYGDWEQTGLADLIQDYVIEHESADLLGMEDEEVAKVLVEFEAEVADEADTSESAEGAGTYGVIVVLPTEGDQDSLIEELAERGLEVRAIM